MRRVLVFVVIFALLLPPLAYAAPTEAIFELLEKYFIEELNPIYLRQNSLGNLATYLWDPYFTYFTPEEFKEYVDGYAGFYGGIGTQITKTEGKITVYDIYPDSPAKSGGLLVGDVFLSIDGKSLADISLSDAAALLRGKPGSTVRIKFSRGAQVREISLIRAIVQSQAVRLYFVGDIAVLEIMSFNNRTPLLVEDALKEIHNFNPRGVILDLRDNPGGSISSVVDVARLFVPAGPIVTMRTRKDGELVLTSFSDPKELKNLVVLINRNTASAAEILAACIRDRQLGVLVGETSYGKASVQSVFRLSDNSGVRFTTARYFPPSGQFIDQVGVSPNVHVTGKKEQLKQSVERIRMLNPTLVFPMGRDSLWSNGATFNLDTRPYLQNGSAYVPVRYLAEHMGFEVMWDQENWLVKISGKNKELTIPIGSNSFIYNGIELELFGKTVLVNGRTMVHARPVAEALGGRVWWDNINRELIVDWK